MPCCLEKTAENNPGDDVLGGISNNTSGEKKKKKRKEKKKKKRQSRTPKIRTGIAPTGPALKMHSGMNRHNRPKVNNVP